MISSYVTACLIRTLYNYEVELSIIILFKAKAKYELINGQWKSSDEVINIYSDLLQSYPGLVGYIDPLHHQVRCTRTTDQLCTLCVCFVSCDLLCFFFDFISQFKLLSICLYTHVCLWQLVCIVIFLVLGFGRLEKATREVRKQMFPCSWQHTKHGFDC